MNEASSCLSPEEPRSCDNREEGTTRELRSGSHMGKGKLGHSPTTSHSELTREGSSVDCGRRGGNEEKTEEKRSEKAGAERECERKTQRPRFDGDGSSLSPRSNASRGSACSTRSCESHEKVGRTLSGDSTGRDGVCSVSSARQPSLRRKSAAEEVGREVKVDGKALDSQIELVRTKNRGKSEGARLGRGAGSACAVSVSPLGTARHVPSGRQPSERRQSAKPLTKLSSSSSSHNKTTMVPTVMNTPTRIEAGRQKFLIFDAPSQENLPAYIEEMRAYEVTDLVRTCERTYDDKTVLASGIRPHELIFPDGEAPPDDVIDEWLTLCNAVSQQRGAIAIHCVAGLGRAPVLVAIALIEKGMDPMDAIMFIRERRKGAINRRQLQFLKGYKRRSNYKKCCGGRCAIM
ncbi:putative protein tyrosine phosphatase type IVA A [Toxoplasma gondii ARI]|uniref:protein-tyrosine-phosphatase n=3 Tax=Toxoplasma gondii TaxID=5811 RepID=A0A2G8XU71_TOXGO|nr:putative protein tyrosine phosphatase type IVA A [Toxoplasma gondii ARI]PIL98573.1 putative protein tyrosine phosphatase type IVA A [Toxoplasma gondii COUG]PUA88253.1 putative protein tyrosine phosphatase type IVA A [Toxoplasma gondii TgCATBr9]